MIFSVFISIWLVTIRNSTVHAVPKASTVPSESTNGSVAHTDNSKLAAAQEKVAEMERVLAGEECVWI